MSGFCLWMFEFARNVSQYRYCPVKLHLASSYTFAAHASFEEATGAAVYPPAAWFLQAPPAAAPAGRAARSDPPAGRAARSDPIPSAVLWPLSEVIDETYSVYCDLS